MLNRQTGARMWSQVSFFRPAPSSAPADLITHVPTPAEAALLFTREDH